MGGVLLFTNNTLMNFHLEWNSCPVNGTSLGVVINISQQGPDAINMAGWGGKALRQETTNLGTRKLAAPGLYRDGGVRWPTCFYL